MILIKKIRIYPNELQQKEIREMIATTRYIYNWTLGKQRENYRNNGKVINDRKLVKELIELKETKFCWLNQVSEKYLKNIVKKVCLKYKRSLKNRLEFPKFKLKRENEMVLPLSLMNLEIKNNIFILEKIGWIKIKESIPANMNWTNPRIIYDNKYWYILIEIEKKIKKDNLTDKSMEIDIENDKIIKISKNRFFKKYDKDEKIKKIERKLNRLRKRLINKHNKNGEKKKYIKTKNIIKVEKQIQLTERKIKNIKNNYYHQITASIVKAKPYRVVIKNKNIEEMREYSKIKKILKYKCKLYGIKLIG